METINIKSDIPISMDNASTDMQTSHHALHDASEDVCNTVDNTTRDLCKDLISQSQVPDENEDSGASCVALANRRRLLVRKIMQYKSVFPDEVDGMNLNNLFSKSAEELQTLADDVQFMVETRQASGHSRQVFLVGCNLGEQILPSFGLKIQGLTRTCATNQQLMECVDEISIKYSKSLMLDPIQRLGLIMAGICIQLHVTSTSSEAEASSARESDVDKLGAANTSANTANATADAISNAKRDALLSKL